MIDKNRVVRNVLSNWGTFIFAALINFFLTPFIVRSLGDAAYGTWVLLVSLTGYMGLLDLGVRGAVTRYVARFHAREDHENAGRITSTALLIFGAIGVVAILVSLAIAVFILPHFHIPAAYQGKARIVIFLIGTSFAISLISGVFGGILIGLQRFDYSNGVEVVVTILRAIAVFLCLRHGLGLVTLALIQASFSLSRLLGNFILTRSLYPQLPVGRQYWGRNELKLIFSYGFYSFLLQMAGSLIIYSDSVVIGAFSEVRWVTFFAIAGSLVDYARSLISGISQTVSPMMSGLEARQRENELRNVFLTAARYATLLALPIAITFALRGHSFIGLWMGPRYADISGQILVVLAVTVFFAGTNHTVGATVLGLGRHKAIVPIHVAEGLCNLALSIFWVRRYGIVGVAWGTTLPNLFPSLLAYPWYMRRVLGIPLQTYYLNNFIRPALSMVPFALVTFAVEKNWPAGNLPQFFLGVAGALTAAVVGAWFVCFSSQERRSHFDSLRAAFSRT
jgi:O-antigen/teichoic acid export membrane protein